MASDLKPAIWDGPFAAELADGRLLSPGDEHMVTEADLLSGHWKPKASKAKASKAGGSAAATPAADTAAHTAEPADDGSGS